MRKTVKTVGRNVTARKDLGLMVESCSFPTVFFLAVFVDVQIIWRGKCSDQYKCIMQKHEEG